MSLGLQFFLHSNQSHQDDLSGSRKLCQIVDHNQYTCQDQFHRKILNKRNNILMNNIRFFQVTEFLIFSPWLDEKVLII